MCARDLRRGGFEKLPDKKYVKVQAPSDRWRCTDLLDFH